jgi:hypothetical protein
MTSSPAASADASAASSSAISSSVSLCVHALGSVARSGPSQPPGKVGRLCFLDDDAEDDEDATARVIVARRGRAAQADARATWVAGEMKAAAADIAAVLRFCAPLGVVTKRSGEP